MTLREQINEERHRFVAFYRHYPDIVYLGRDQMEQIESMIRELEEWGLIVKDAMRADPMLLDGMAVFKVEARTFLGFGLKQPSPCG